MHLGCEDPWWDDDNDVGAEDEWKCGGGVHDDAMKLMRKSRKGFTCKGEDESQDNGEGKDKDTDNEEEEENKAECDNDHHQLYHNFYLISSFLLEFHPLFLGSCHQLSKIIEIYETIMCYNLVIHFWGWQP